MKKSFQKIGWGLPGMTVLVGCIDNEREQMLNEY